MARALQRREFGAITTEWTTRASGFLLGRRTYEIFAAHWPKVTDPADAIAGALNSRPKYLAWRTLKRVDWNGSSLLRGDVAKAVSLLKAEPGGEILVWGSGDLLQTLFKHDLVDTFRIWQFPLVLGSGQRLFREGAIARGFRLVDTQMTNTGAVLHVCQRAGGLRYGEFEAGRQPVIFESTAASG